MNSIYNENTNIYQNRSYIKDVELSDDFNRLFTICGRVLFIRVHSKITFLQIRDVSSNIQVAVMKDSDIDINSIVVGTIALFSGKLFVTSSKQKALNVTSFQVLSQPSKPFTNKYFGAYNKVLNCIVNEEYLNLFKQRQKIIQLIRSFLSSHDFVEAETPILQAVPSGGDNIHTFDTMHNAMGKKMYLRVAPECFLKRMIIAGFEKVFELARCFRNEGISYKHNPEFTLLEVYKAYCGLDEMMNIVEELIDFLLYSLQLPSITIRRISFIDMVNAYINDDCMSIDIEKLQNITSSNNTNRIELLDEIFDKKISDNIMEPTFVIHLPLFCAPLARYVSGNELFAERAELYISGMEMTNLCVELRDPQQQRKLLENTLGDDKNFLDDLMLAMPPLAGFGIGVDRLISFLLKTSTVRDSMLFS